MLTHDDYRAAPTTFGKAYRLGEDGDLPPADAVAAAARGLAELVERVRGEAPADLRGHVTVVVTFVPEGQPHPHGLRF